MATITTKVCDRCGAQHVQAPGSIYQVQQVKWLVPPTEHLHITGEQAKELCTPCRAGLSQLIRDYLDVSIKIGRM